MRCERSGEQGIQNMCGKKMMSERETEKKIKIFIEKKKKNEEVKETKVRRRTLTEIKKKKKILLKISSYLIWKETTAERAIKKRLKKREIQRVGEKEKEKKRNDKDEAKEKKKSFGEIPVNKLMLNARWDYKLPWQQTSKDPEFKTTFEK